MTRNPTQHTYPLETAGRLMTARDKIPTVLTVSVYFITASWLLSG